MSGITKFLIDYGYLVVFAGVLAEQLGLPAPSAPILLAAGALVGLGRLNLFYVIALAVTAALLSDLMWFFLGRRKGAAILAFLCKVSLEPDTCISKTHSAYSRYGPRSLLFSKFVPGLNTLGPPMAGMYGVAAWKFIALDSAGALGWSGTFVALGWVFRLQLEDLAAGLARFGSWLGIVLVLGLAVYVTAKYYRRRRLYHALRSARITPGELKRQLDAGETPTIVDLRSEFERQEGAIPGALALAYQDVDSLPTELTNGDVVLYCSCPNEITAVRAAIRLRRRGVARVRPLLGGFAGWRDLGYPVEHPALPESAASDDHGGHGDNNADNNDGDNERDDVKFAT